MDRNSFLFGLSLVFLLAFGSSTDRELVELERAQKVEHFINKQIVDQQNLIEIRKGRYQDGIDIVKTLYEKLLDLDHHYSSQSISQEIETISNFLFYLVIVPESCTAILFHLDLTNSCFVFWFYGMTCLTIRKVIC